MKTVVIGVGNILFMDEGVGVYASRLLQENYTFEPEIEVIDGGTLGFNLMEYYHDYEKVIILDTVSIKDEPGSIYFLPSEALMGLGDYKQTVHEVEVLGMLELSSMLEQVAEVNVIGIIPEDIQSVQIDLTKTLKQAFPGLIEKTLQSLQDTGVIVKEKPMPKHLDEIIGLYNSAVARKDS